MKLQGKTGLVTGGSEGLGFFIAKKLAERGVRVVICARSNKKLREARKKIKGELFAISCDVSDHSQIEETVKKVGDIDILINNAGVWNEGELEEHQKEDIDRLIDINLKGVIYTTRAVLPLMRKKNDGFIVNTSSTSGLKGRQGQSVYVASKYGVTGFTESLKLDLKDTNIRVVGFYPGGMATGLFQKAGFKKDNRDWMDPEEVAEIVIFILERDESLIMDHVVVNKRGTKASN